MQERVLPFVLVAFLLAISTGVSAVPCQFLLSDFEGILQDGYDAQVDCDGPVTIVLDTQVDGNPVLYGGNTYDLVLENGMGEDDIAILPYLELYEFKQIEMNGLGFVGPVTVGSETVDFFINQSAFISFDGIPFDALTFEGPTNVHLNSTNFSGLGVGVSSPSGKVFATHCGFLNMQGYSIWGKGIEIEESSFSNNTGILIFSDNSPAIVRGCSIADNHNITVWGSEVLIEATTFQYNEHSDQIIYSSQLITNRTIFGFNTASQVIKTENYVDDQSFFQQNRVTQAIRTSGNVSLSATTFIRNDNGGFFDGDSNSIVTMKNIFLDGRESLLIGNSTVEYDVDTYPFSCFYNGYYLENFDGNKIRCSNAPTSAPEEPTTESPTTENPATEPSTSEEPETTSSPSSSPSSSPATSEPTTEEPLTFAPTTRAPTSPPTPVNLDNITFTAPKASETRAILTLTGDYTTEQAANLISQGLNITSDRIKINDVKKTQSRKRQTTETIIDFSITDPPGSEVSSVVLLKKLSYAIENNPSSLPFTAKSLNVVTVRDEGLTQASPTSTVAQRASVSNQVAAQFLFVSALLSLFL